MKILSQNYAEVTYIHSILDKCAPMYLDILKLRIFSVPKTLAIFLSGVKKWPFSGSFKPCSLMYANKCFIHCPRLASSTPQISANSSESFMGLVSPLPLDILELFVILGDLSIEYVLPWRRRISEWEKFWKIQEFSRLIAEKVHFYWSIFWIYQINLIFIGRI